MPFVEIKVFEDELSSEETQKVIEGVTDAIVSVCGEPLLKCGAPGPPSRLGRFGEASRARSA